MRIKELTFVAGRLPGDGPTTIDCDPVIALVGPNSSGKSRALQEIDSVPFQRESSGAAVVRSVQYVLPEDVETAIEFIRKFEVPAPQSGRGLVNSIWHISNGGSVSTDNWEANRIDTERIARTVEVASDLELPLAQLLQPFSNTRFWVEDRLDIAQPKMMGDLTAHPRNFIMHLFQQDELRDSVRSLIHKATNRYLVVDPTSLSMVQLRLSDHLPADAAEERGLTRESVRFHRAATPVDQMGHGLRAYIGLIASISAVPYGTVLVDEPELFLHPPFARRLGQDLSRIVVVRGSSLVAATHSADFLQGCLDQAPTTIVRLTFDGSSATARALDSSEVRRLVRHPLMRSARTIECLFHRGAVVCESDDDRAFYDEINTRLLADGTGARDVRFLNARGVHSISEMVAPLRRFGVPAAAVADLDVLSLSDSDAFKKLLEACNMPRRERERLQATRIAVSHAAASKDEFKKSGVSCLPSDLQPRAASLLSELAAYGCFLVPVGELEQWLKSLGVEGGKTNWLLRVFDKLGSDDQSAGYVRPSPGDVWNFVNRIAEWINNPYRLGL